MVCVKVMLTLAQVPGQRRVKLVWHLQQLSPFHSCKHQVWILQDPSWSMVIHSIRSPSLCWAWCIEQSADPRRQFCRSIVAKTSETWAVWTVWFMINMCVFERRLHRQPLVARHPIPCHRCQGSSGESSNFADVDLGFLPPLLLAWLGCTCQLFNTTCKHVWRNAASNRRWSHGLYTINYVNICKYWPARTETTWNILEHYLVTEALFRNGDVCRQDLQPRSLCPIPSTVPACELWRLTTRLSVHKSKGKSKWQRTIVQDMSPCQEQQLQQLCLVMSSSKVFANKSRSAVGSHCGRMKAKHAVGNGQHMIALWQ